MLYELRQYHVLPGKQAAWVQMMEEEIIPFQVSKGMVILGSFIGEEDDSVYVWLRRFADEEERVRLYEAVYESEHWKTNVGPRVRELIDREGHQITRLTPTAKSPLQ
jgi:hypothetical protein